MNIGWPEGIYLALTFIGLGMSISRHGELKKADVHNCTPGIVGSAVVIGLLYWGGFFA